MSDKKTLDNQDVSEIDRAIAAAKARRTAKGGSTSPTVSKEPKAAKEPSASKRPRLSDEEKATRLQAQDTVRAERLAERAAVKAAKLAERTAGRTPAHMAKVTKAALRLGTLDQAAMLLLNEATANLSASELANLAQHILHFNRVKATERAINQRLTVGMTVTVISGDPRYVGKTGIVSKAQRIRAYVQVEGVAKAIYVFTSDCVPTQEQQVAATA